MRRIYCDGVNHNDIASKILLIFLMSCALTATAICVANILVGCQAASNHASNAVEALKHPRP